MRTIFDWYDFQQEYSDEAFIDEELALEYAADFLDVEEEPPLFDEDCYIPENEDDPDAPIALNTLREQVDETAVERIGTAARKETDFSIVVAEMDRLDQNRMRRERYHEKLRGDVPLEFGAADGGKAFPRSLDTAIQHLIRSGNFLDLYYDCPYEMHQLTADFFLSKMVEELKSDHKEVLYFLSLQLYTPVQLAKMRKQSDRNIRKIRDTYTRKLQRKLYDHLCQKRNLSLREKEFIASFEASIEQAGKRNARVRREKKCPRRKKAALIIDDNEGG